MAKHSRSNVNRLDRFDDADVRVRDDPQGFPSLKMRGRIALQALGWLSRAFDDLVAESPRSDSRRRWTPNQSRYSVPAPSTRHQWRHRRGCSELESDGILGALFPSTARAHCRSGLSPILGVRRGRQRPSGWQEACRPRTALGFRPGHAASRAAPRRHRRRSRW